MYMRHHLIHDMPRTLLLTMCATAVAFTESAGAAELSDGQIVGIYIQVNGFDIDTALLGRAQGGDAVRRLAEHVAADHIGVRQAAYAIAERCAATPQVPPERSAAALEHDKALAALMALRGADFDRAYLHHELLFHRAAIDAVKTALLPSAHCPELQAHFRAVLPAFEHHLAETEALAQQIR
jgi:putative membrane protein